MDGRKRPTIAELEAILNAESGPAVNIRPDGTVLVGEEARTIPWHDPTPDMLADPKFEAVWQLIKSWDVNVPGAYIGYMGANGNHVRAILDALATVPAGIPPLDHRETCECQKCGRLHWRLAEHKM